MNVSLAFLGDHAMKSLNEKWRGKKTQANVLAFPYDAHSGEIVINPHQAQREAQMYGIGYNERIVHLFVHGLLHLMGYDHERKEEALKMERYELRIMRKISGNINSKLKCQNSKLKRKTKN